MFWDSPRRLPPPACVDGVVASPILAQVHLHPVSRGTLLALGLFFLKAGAGLITPGPVVITEAFIGYLVGGLTGAFVGTVAIFLPIYLGVVLPDPRFIRHKEPVLVLPAAAAGIALHPLAG
jgi:hypothetical protein